MKLKRIFIKIYQFIKNEYLQNPFLEILGKLFQHSKSRRSLSFVLEYYYLYKNPLPYLKKRGGYPFQILVYHRILPEKDPFAIGVVSINEFEKHIEALLSYFRIISLEKLIMELKTGEMAPNRICITFDDGYFDNFKYAFQILKKYGVPATIFLTTDYIGTNEILWHDKVLYAIKNTTLKYLQFGDSPILKFHLRNQHEKIRTAHLLLEWLKKYPVQERNKWIEKILDICGISYFPRKRMMLDWPEILEMEKFGVNFGAHTKTHPILSSLEDDQIREEVYGSKRIIEEKLGKSILTFAYPNGKLFDFDERSKKIVKEAGFHCAVTTCNGVNQYDQDRYKLARFLPWDLDRDRFLGRIIWTRLKGY